MGRRGCKEDNQSGNPEPKNFCSSIFHMEQREASFKTQQVKLRDFGISSSLILINFRPLDLMSKPDHVKLNFQTLCHGKSLEMMHYCSPDLGFAATTRQSALHWHRMRHLHCSSLCFGIHCTTNRNLGDPTVEIIVSFLCKRRRPPRTSPKVDLAR